MALVLPAALWGGNAWGASADGAAAGLTVRAEAVADATTGPADLRVGLTNPGRMVSLALVAIGVLVVVTSWRRGGSAEGEPRRRERGQVFAMLGVLLVLYGLLFNGQWVPGGGDEALYLSIGRTIVRTGTFCANVVPVVTVPYGWPCVIAGALYISGSFVFLNLVPLSLIVAGSVLWYVVLRRLTSPALAFATVLLAAVLFHWQRCVLHFYSESLFYPLLALATLLSLQIAEGRPWGVRAAALALTAAAMVLSRFAGVLALPLLAAILLSGHGWRQARGWVTVVLVGAVLGGTFLSVRLVLKRDAEQQIAQARLRAESQPKAAAPAAEAAAGTLERTLRRDLGVQERILDRAVAASPVAYVQRLTSAGTWISRLLWPPAELGKTNRTIRVASNVVGWVLLVMLLVLGVDGIRRGQWIWAGVIAYCGALTLIWPEPNGRYIAGVAPLLLLGVLLGGQRLAELSPAVWWRRPVKALAWGLTGSVILCNVPIYLVDVWVNQSPHFHSLVLAGEHRELTSAFAYLNRRNLADGELAVATGGKRGQMPRVASFLTNRLIQIAPFEGRPDAAVLRWARENQARYYLCRSPQAPRRIWHVKLSPGTPRPDGSPASYLELYELRDGLAQRVRPADTWPVDRVFDLRGAPVEYIASSR